MKKIAVLISGAFLLMNTAFAGGILTNSNQSAQFVRMLSRNASTDLDAVYFNPAGLTQLKNGFYFGLHNQSITQTKTATSEFPYLHKNGDKPMEYIGDVKAPVFPTAFAIYKLDNWAFSAGFGPNGGGGSAKYDKGLPSFEKSISSLVPSMAGLKTLGYDISDYDVKIAFEGTSVFWGIQLGATYKINDILSVYGGARYLPSVNTYNGSITDISLKVNGQMQPANAWLKATAGGVRNLAAQVTGLTTIAPSLQPLLSTAIADMKLSDVPATYIPDANKIGIVAGLVSLGLTTDQIATMDVKTIQATYAAATPGLQAKANQLNVLAPTLDETAAKVEDKYVDTKQTGAGITPIIGFDIHLNKLNVGVKYEHQTTLILTNKPSEKDNYSGKLFGEKFGNDIPAIISAGADYKITDALKISGSFTSYIDNWVGWGNNVYGQHRSIDKNYLELAFGAEYQLNKKFAISAGYLNSNTGVSETYQSDFSYSNDSYTAGLGFQWNINKKLVLDAGMMLTTYKDFTKTFDSTGKFNEDNTNLITKFGAYNETYGKDTFTFAFGIGYKIF
jgi:long-subunit fatty acid transport protein